MNDSIKDITEIERPKSVVISCRLSQTEYDEFSSAYKKQGFKADSTALRIAAKEYSKRINKKSKKKLEAIATGQDFEYEDSNE